MKEKNESERRRGKENINMLLINILYFERREMPRDAPIYVAFHRASTVPCAKQHASWLRV